MSESPSSIGHTISHGGSFDPFTPKSKHPWTKKDNDCLLAQLYAVSYLHMFLPMCPVAWICYELDRNQCFLKHVYVKLRRRTTLHMALCMILILVYGSCIYANTLMPFSCSPHIVRVEPQIQNATGGAISRVQLQKDGCAYEEHLWAFHPEIGLRSLFSAFFFAAVGKAVMHVNQSGAFALMVFAEYCLPRVFYSGLGPVGSRHSGWKLLGDDFSYLRDCLGSADVLLLCLATALVTFTSSIWVAYSVSGVGAASAGAAVGAVLARFVLIFLNYAVGASNELITCVNGELLSFQPHRRLLTGDLNEVNEAYIDREVTGTVRFLERAAATLQGDDKAVVDAMAVRVREEGKDIVVYVAKWLQSNKNELPFLQGSCFRLFSTKTSTYTCVEYELAALSMMKCRSFLVAYVAKKQTDLKLLQWDTKFLLSSVYITNPDKAVCRNDSGWQLQHHNRQVKKSETTDFAGASDDYRSMP